MIFIIKHYLDKRNDIQKKLSGDQQGVLHFSFVFIIKILDKKLVPG